MFTVKLLLFCFSHPMVLPLLFSFSTAVQTAVLKPQDDKACLLMRMFRDGCWLEDLACRPTICLSLHVPVKGELFSLRQPK